MGQQARGDQTTGGSATATTATDSSTDSGTAAKDSGSADVSQAVQELLSPANDSGSATSSKALFSASMPRKISTTPPTIITTAASR